MLPGLRCKAAFVHFLDSIGRANQSVKWRRPSQNTRRSLRALRRWPMVPHPWPSSLSTRLCSLRGGEWYSRESVWGERFWLNDGRRACSTGPAVGPSRSAPKYRHWVSRRSRFPSAAVLGFSQLLFTVISLQLAKTLGFLTFPSLDSSIFRRVRSPGFSFSSLSLCFFFSGWGAEDGSRCGLWEGKG